MSEDYYQILGVERGANQADIKTAFRKAAHKHHPDKQGGDAEKFKKINEAYQVLSDEQKKAQYDKFGQTFEQGNTGGAGGFGGFGSANGGAGGPFGANANFTQADLGDLFGDLFGFGRRGGRGGVESHGEDLAIRVKLDFKEAVFGVKKNIAVNRLAKCETCAGSGDVSGKAQTCSTCKGAGRVRQMTQTILGALARERVCETCGGDGKVPQKPCTDCSGQGRRKKKEMIEVEVPAGIDIGQVLRMRGQGQAGRRGKASGDLLITVEVKSSDKFVRDGFDIKTRLELEYPQVVLGDKVELEGLAGRLELEIPAGTEPGRVIRLKGEGVPVLNGGNGRGDLFVEIDVVSPKKVSAQEKELLERFLALRGKKITKKKRTFFG